MKMATLAFALFFLITGCAHYQSGGSGDMSDTTTGYGSSGTKVYDYRTSSDMDDLGYYNNQGPGTLQKPNGQPRFPGRSIDSGWGW